MFRVNAVINWALAIRGIVDPVGMAAAFGGPPPNYPFLIRLWSGLVFMFGVMFWDIATDVRGKASFVKYNWIEKLITASAVTLGFTSGDIPGRLMLLIVFTNWLWIPAIAFLDLGLRRERRARGRATSAGGPGEMSILDQHHPSHARQPTRPGRVRTATERSFMESPVVDAFLRAAGATGTTSPSVWGAKIRQVRRVALTGCRARKTQSEG